jgi:hypothetical protein
MSPPPLPSNDPSRHDKKHNKTNRKKFSSDKNKSNSDPLVGGEEDYYDSSPFSSSKEECDNWENLLEVLPTNLKTKLTKYHTSSSSSLSDAVQFSHYIAPVKSPEELNYDQLISNLPLELKDKLSVQNVKIRNLERTNFYYYVVDCPDGGWSTVRTFSSLEDCAKYIYQNRENDSVVWVFYGIRLPIYHLVKNNNKLFLQHPFKETVTSISDRPKSYQIIDNKICYENNINQHYSEVKDGYLANHFDTLEEEDDDNVLKKKEDVNEDE